LRLNMSFNETALSVVYEPTLAESNITRTDKEVIVYLGKDVIYGKGKVELLALKDILAEAVACFLLEDYEKLTEESRTDENAFLKIENMKMLLNWRSHSQLYHRFINRYARVPENYWGEKTPDERKRLEEKYRHDLDGFTENWQNIRQYNIFMNIMDDADPMALVFNYIHILSKDPVVADKDVYRMINEISRVNVRGKASIARVRNVLKEFYFNGKVNIRQADGNVAGKEKFNDLDNSERLAEMRDVLLATRDINTFYRTLRLVFESMLPLGDDALKKDVGMVFEKFGNKILDSEDREEALRAVIKEVLVRRIGSAAFTSLTEHLSANRGYKDIPYIEICPRELAEGTDADEYEFLRYVPDVDGTYDLFAGEEKAPEDRDWVLGLFPVKAAPGEDDDDKGGHGTALRDFGMLVVATAGASSISPWLGIVVGILACCVVVGHMTDMLGPSPAPQGAPSTGAGVNNERPPAPAGTRQIFEGSMSFGRVVSRLPDFIAKYILMFKRNSIQKKIRKTGIRWKKKNRALLPYGLEKELSVLIKDGKRRPGMEAPQVAAFEVAAMLNSELGFIIEKLLTNASDACMRKMNVDPDSSAKIDVRIFTAQSDLVIEITDNGPGLIDEAGSPLIRTLVKCHNGKVEWNNIASPDGVIEGAKATITLPVREIVGVPDRPASDTIDPRFTSSGSQDALNEARVQEILKKLGFVPREGETFRYIVYEPRLKQISGQLTPTDYSALFDYFWNRNGTGLLFPEELKAKLILAWWNLPKCHMSFILNGHPDGGVIAKLLEMKIVTNDKEEQFLWELFRIRAPEWSNRDLTELREKAPRMMDEIDMEIGRAKRPVRVLDLGCGSEGRAVRDLKSYYGDKIEAFGVDLQTYDENIEGVTLKPANIRNLPFEDNSFDLIYEYLALDALTGEPLKRSISEAMRVLAPGGKFMISQSINQEEIYTILDRLGIDHEITGDTPFIIIKKAASERSTLAAENGSISARAEPTIDELPSGIEEVIFNGERAGPETVRRKISESAKGKFIFNAIIEGELLRLGFLAEDNGYAHGDIEDPKYGYGVFRGEIANGEIVLLLGGMHNPLNFETRRDFGDHYI
ncbi:MAG: methyltransferase domain-containing protein, partial [Candidatus Omnitrophota bacterium]